MSSLADTTTVSPASSSQENKTKKEKRLELMRLMSDVSSYYSALPIESMSESERNEVLREFETKMSKITIQIIGLD